MATLNETCPLKSRINVAKKGTTIPLISLCPKSKKGECDQMDLNISDQLETLIPFSTIYFLGVRIRPLQKLSTGNSCICKKTSWFTIFVGRILRLKYTSATEEIHDFLIILQLPFLQIFSGGVSTLFTESSHQRFFQI